MQTNDIAVCDRPTITNPHEKETPHSMLLIISGPSGVGKTTLAHEVENQLHASFSVSMTTRPKAMNDVESEDYFFVTPEQFTEARTQGRLLESAKVFGHWYGTPRDFVEKNLAVGRLVILEIDVEGATQIKRNMPDAFAIFILPPSEDVLLDRLRNRKREDEATIQRRFAKAKDEITRAHASGVYDRFVVNDDLAHATAEAMSAVENELAKRQEPKKRL